MGRVGDYELLETLGEGSFSKVKSCRHIPTGKYFVAKIIRKSHQRVEDDVRLEISILRRLKHRNIVQLIEILETANNYYIILEAVTGGDLCDLVTGLEHPLPEQDVAALLIQLVTGVRACHQNGVAHRDLKPENLLLTVDGILKISDFGLSRLHRESNFQARADEYAETLTGTLAYVAPEVLEKKYDAFRADIWSMGCIAYVLLTNKFPFGSVRDERRLEQRIRAGQMDTMPTHVSEEAKELCTWLLSRNPSDRPSLDEVAHHRFFVKNLPANCVPWDDTRRTLVEGATTEEFSSQVPEPAAAAAAGALHAPVGTGATDPSAGVPTAMRTGAPERPSARPRPYVRS